MHQKDDDVRSSGKDDVSPDSTRLTPATPKEGDGKQQALRENLSSDVAIIGISGRFAGSPNLEAFWDHLQAGRSCIEEIKRAGWEVSIHSDPDLERSYPSQVKWGGILQGIDQFDPLFFNISPLEAARMDPQQRLFLEEAYKAFEDAGYSAEQLSEKKVGVFVGARPSDYKELRGDNALHNRRDSAPHNRRDSILRLSEELDAHLFLGNDMAILAARISYFLNCKGPSLTVDTASSSSLVAIHLACESIRTGESEMALAGGVFVMSSPEYAIMAAKTQMLSPDGRCKTFDKSANGTVIGEGVGTLVLKPLATAIADGDHLYGVIKGSSINQDGKTFGMTAPSLLSQKTLLSDVYKRAAIDPETLSYIEAHGTGSQLGDPIEVQALTEAFRLFTEKKQFCAIGSHKPNIGHTISSAGIAGVLKILLAMKYQQIPPTINVEEVNPQIDLQSSPFFLNTELRAWQSPDSRKRRAGVSSFGLSGTNCHIILEEPPQSKPTTHEQARPAFFFPFSAKTKAALAQKVQDMINWLEKEGGKYAIEDIAYTLVQGRSHFVMRTAVVARDTDDLLHALRELISKGGSEHDEIKGKGQGSEQPELLFKAYGDWLLQELRANNKYDQNKYKESLAVLADIYMKGYNLDWGQLFQKGRYQRVPLPTYPFIGESYWITKSTMHERYSVGAEGGGKPRSYAPCPCGEIDRLPGQGQAAAPTDSPPTPFVEIPTDRLREMLSHMVSGLLKVRVEEINAKTELSEYGFDSITFTEFANRLNQTYQLDLTPAHFFAYSTLERLAQYLHTTYASILAPYFAAVSPVNTSGDIPDTSARKGREGASPIGANLKASVRVEHTGEASSPLHDGTSIGTVPSCSGELASPSSPASPPVPDTRSLKFALMGASPSSTQRSVDAGEGSKSRGVDGELTLSPDRGQPHPSLRGSVNAATPIAIIGMSGCFPQAPDVQSLWNNLLEGKDCISEIPSSRWDWQSYFGNPATAANKTNVKRGGIVEDVELFDPLFFGISPSEAEQMDPQQRLLMMYIWKAIEDAGYAASSLSGTRTGLFVGTTSSGYNERVSRANIAIEGYSSTGMTPSVGPNRMSYFLNLHGPSEAIETACSSSLVAIHRGVSAIESGQCTMAIVGGVNTLVSPELHISYSKAGMLSEDGRCKTFSAQANGYVRGEGIGILVLKKLTDAEQTGDHIYGVIRGSAENHGGRASSLTAPNPRAQADLLIAAYCKAEIDPRTVGYIEAHGTGTPLGDPIEINGLKTAFNELTQTIGEGPMPEAVCGVGSLKSNIGHLELAAGVAGVIKVLLQLQHKKLVQSLHCEQLNPYIQLEASPFYIVQEKREWEAMRDHEGNVLPRRAGVSSFGFGGANAHVVIEEYVPKPVVTPLGISASPLLIVLSAKNEERLYEQVQQLLTWVQARTYTEERPGQANDQSEAPGWHETPDRGRPYPSLQSLAYTLQVGREALEERLALQVSSFAELAEKLQRYLQEPQEKGHWYRGQVRRHKAALFGADEEVQEALQATVSKWIQRGKYEKLLEWWIKGLRIEWQHLYGEHLPQRISLPTYPFARERYWISSGASSGPAVACGLASQVCPIPTGGQTERFTATTVSSLPVLHPLVQHNTSTLWNQQFSSTFRGDEFSWPIM